MLRTISALTLLVAALSATPPARAWGKYGHWAIGEIAQCQLEHTAPEVIERAEEILSGGDYADDTGDRVDYATLSAAGYWADRYARRQLRFDSFAVEHYINLDPTADRVNLERDCPGSCILRAIERLQVEVVDASRSPAERRESLLFLIHFVEDLHQPLHIVHPDGQGGNRTRVELFGEATNLHSVWDSGLIEHRLESSVSMWGRLVGRQAWEEWAADLCDSISESDRKAWTVNMDPTAWAEEAVEPSRRYAFDVRSGDRLDETYYEPTIGVVEERIKRAAVRLAALLQDTLAEN